MPPGPKSHLCLLVSQGCSVGALVGFGALVAFDVGFDVGLLVVSKAALNPAR